MSNNLQYCKKETRDYVNAILTSPSVHFFTKEIIKEGLTKDTLDAVKDVQFALEALTTVMEDH